GSAADGDRGLGAASLVVFFVDLIILLEILVLEVVFVFIFFVVLFVAFLVILIVVGEEAFERFLAFQVILFSAAVEDFHFYFAVSAKLHFPSLAGYAYQHGQSFFPVVLEAVGKTVFVQFVEEVQDLLQTVCVRIHGITLVERDQ